MALQECQAEGHENENYSNVDQESPQEVVSEEEEVHADHDGNERDHVEHDGRPSSHQSKLSAPGQDRTRQSEIA